MSATHDPFLLTLDRYAAAVRSKDVAAYVALYDEDVHVFDLWADWSLRGLRAWRDMTEGWFSSLGSEYVEVGADDAHATVSGDLAIGYAFLTYTAYSGDGRRLRWLSNRITMALGRKDGVWKILHQHTSVPIDGASMTAMLQRAR